MFSPPSQANPPKRSSPESRPSTIMDLRSLPSPMSQCGSAMGSYQPLIPAQHKSNNRQSESNLIRIFLTWYLLVWHAFVVIVLALLMIYCLDGTRVNNKDRYSDKRTYLCASDITTIVTGALVIVRIATTAWSALAAWRCVYVLLENDGLDLEQLDWIVSWRLPRTANGKYSWLVILVLCLIWPSQFAAPLLSGAVDWRNAEAYYPNGTVWMGGVGYNYSTYADSPLFRRDRVNEAITEFTSVSLATSTEPGLRKQQCRRYVEINRTLPLGSKVENAMFPCITINSISWDTAPLSKAVEDILTDSTSLIITTALPPFTIISKYATTAMLNLEPWTHQSSEPQSNIMGALPPPSVFRGEKKVAILLSPFPGVCMNATTQLFGPSNPEATLLNVTWTGLEQSDTTDPCFLVATLDITAGVARAPEAKLISHRVLEAVGDLAVQEDPFVTQALYLMPEVMATVSNLNFTSMPTWQNRDGFVESLVRYAYHTTWSSMQNQFSSESSKCNAELRVEMLEVSVSRSRVAYWLAINALVTLSGLVLMITERNSTRPIVVDVAAGAIALDASALLDKRKELTRLSYVTRKDAAVGKLRLGKVDDQFALFPPEL